MSDSACESAFESASEERLGAARARFHAPSRPGSATLRRAVAPRDALTADGCAARPGCNVLDRE
eukprot:6196092-Pleurochrysis_carterae.AAC.3